jgi:hypothetical protein
MARRLDPDMRVPIPHDDFWEGIEVLRVHGALPEWIRRARRIVLNDEDFDVVAARLGDGDALKRLDMPLYNHDGTPYTGPPPVMPAIPIWRSSMIPRGLFAAVPPRPALPSAVDLRKWWTSQPTAERKESTPNR